MEYQKEGFFGLKENGMICLNHKKKEKKKWLMKEMKEKMKDNALMKLRWIIWNQAPGLPKATVLWVSIKKKWKSPQKIMEKTNRKDKLKSCSVTTFLRY